MNRNGILLAAVLAIAVSAVTIVVTTAYLDKSHKEEMARKDKLAKMAVGFAEYDKYKQRCDYGFADPEMCLHVNASRLAFATYYATEIAK